LAPDLSVFSFDMRAGYRTPTGWFFGLIYSTFSGTGSATMTGSALGNSVGYFDGVFSAMLSIYLTAVTQESNSAVSLHRSEGTGVQLDVGCMFPIGSGFSFGPMMTYKNFTYNKMTDQSGLVTSTATPEISIAPYLALSFNF
jgi:outer membrane autotransporter protein